MPQSLPELRAAEAEVAREGHWLHDALNEIVVGPPRVVRLEC
jgi:hypothetical protein